MHCPPARPMRAVRYTALAPQHATNCCLTEASCDLSMSLHRSNAHNHHDASTKHHSQAPITWPHAAGQHIKIAVLGGSISAKRATVDSQQLWAKQLHRWLLSVADADCPLPQKLSSKPNPHISRITGESAEPWAT